MTIFAHTWELVLSGEKTQTSRIWKDDYFFPSDYYDKTIYTHLLSLKSWDAGKLRTLYSVGQVRSVQKSRGTKGIAKIRILELARRDVRAFTDEDIKTEGFPHKTWFLHVWAEMHDKPMYNKLDYAELGSWHEEVAKRPKQFYDALVLKFKLLP